MKKLILNSGGYDSTTLLYREKEHDITSLFFDYNQLSLVPESWMARKNAELLGIEHRYVRIPFSWGLPRNSKSKNNYYPYRNLIFLANALSIAEAENFDAIVIGIIKCPPEYYYKDTHPSFIEWFSCECEASGIELETPLADMEKDEVYKYGAKLGVKVTDTWSCDTPHLACGYNYTRCGVCNDCMQLKDAIDNGVVAPLDFAL